jgi:hypothetical protein
VNGELVAEAAPTAVAVSVNPTPERSTARFGKVAMPFTAVTVFVPLSSAPFVPVPDVISIVMLLLAVGIVVPVALCTDTCTDGVIAAPVFTVVG